MLLNTMLLYRSHFFNQHIKFCSFGKWVNQGYPFYNLFCTHRTKTTATLYTYISIEEVAPSAHFIAAAFIRVRKKRNESIYFCSSIQSIHNYFFFLGGEGRCVVLNR